MYPAAVTGHNRWAKHYDSPPKTNGWIAPRPILPNLEDNFCLIVVCFLVMLPLLIWDVNSDIQFFLYIYICTYIYIYIQKPTIHICKHLAMMLTFFFPALFFNWSKPPQPTTRPSIPDRHNASFPSRPPPSGDLNDPMVDVDYNSLCIHYLVMRNILVSPLWDPLFINQDLFYQLSLWNQCKAAFHVGRMINLIMNGLIFHP